MKAVVQKTQSEGTYAVRELTPEVQAHEHKPQQTGSPRMWRGTAVPDGMERVGKARGVADLPRTSGPERAAALEAVAKNSTDMASLLSFQEELLEISKAYAKTVRHNGHGSPRDNAAWVSRLRGTEGPELVRRSLGGQHVLSVGSGADVFRPLRDFPNADHYHLVDVLSHWGTSPRQFLFEMTERLKSLGPDATVRIVKNGFLDQVPAQTRRDGKAFEEYIHRFGEVLQPLTFEVSWTSKTLGAMKKKFSLHPVSFYSSDQTRILLGSLPNHESLGGVLLTGTLPDAPDNLLEMIRSLSPRGAFVVDPYRNDSRYAAFLGELGKEFDHVECTDDMDDRIVDCVYTRKEAHGGMA